MDAAAFNGRAMEEEVTVERVGPTLVMIAASVSGAIAAMVIVLALFASHAMWIVLPIGAILAAMGCLLGVVAWRASVGAD